MVERAQHIRVDWKGGEEEEEEEEHFHLSPAKDSSCGLIYSSDPIEWWKYLASLLDLIELVTISVFSQPTSAWCNQRGRTRIRPDTAHTHTHSAWVIKSTWRGGPQRASHLVGPNQLGLCLLPFSGQLIRAILWPCFSFYSK